jgi:hypothetical protein
MDGGYGRMSGQAVLRSVTGGLLANTQERVVSGVGMPSAIESRKQRGRRHARPSDSSS